MQGSLKLTSHLISLKSSDKLCHLWGVSCPKSALEAGAWFSKSTVLADLGTQELRGLGNSVTDNSGH